MPRPPRLPTLRVPTARDVLPGARVDIVLKADQPTGRTVRGVVRDVLTRGDHPRGIKVRLADGRVGRVQALPAAAEDITPPLPPPPPQQQQQQQREQNQRGGEAPGPAGTSSIEVPLDAYLRPARRRGTGRGGEVQSAREEGPRDASQAVKCPVCDVFEGDEAAVAHHVASHFDV